MKRVLAILLCCCLVLPLIPDIKTTEGFVPSVVFLYYSVRAFPQL